jgi:hypothetical protein
MFIFMEYLGANNVVENILGSCVQLVLSPSTNDRTKKDLAGAILMLHYSRCPKLSFNFFHIHWH